MRLWPDTLPYSDRPGYGFTPFDQTRRTDMEVGPARARRISTARRDRIELSWTFTDSEMNAFRAWFGDEAVSLAGDSHDLSPWARTRMTHLADAIVGPGGVLADQLTENAATGDFRVDRPLGFSLVAGSNALLRATLRSAGRDFSRMGFLNRDGTFCYTVTNLQTGTFGASGNLVSRSIEDRGDGWYRVTMIAPIGAGASEPAMRLAFMQDGATVTYTGDGVSGQSVCEVQVRMVTGHDLFVASQANGRAYGAAGGAAWVKLPLAFGGGIETVECRFNGPFQATLQAGLKWAVSADVEVRHA